MTISATTQGIKPGVCTSTNRPAAPFDGQVIYMTDVDQTAVWDGSQWTVLAPIAGGRNRLINGDFKVWQRGTSKAMATSSGTGYLADRWTAARGGYAAGGTVSRQTTGLDGFQYCSRVQRDSANTGTSTIYYFQTMESSNCIPLINKTVSYSFYIRAGANLSGSVVAKLYSGTSTDQTNYPDMNPVNSVTVITSTLSLTTSWQRVTLSGTVGSTAAQLFAGFEWTPTGTAGAADYFEITGVQLEAGAVATPFEFEDAQVTLAKCQRYFEKSYNVDTPPGTATTLDQAIGLGIYTNTPAGYNRFGQVYFKVSKRAIPTVTQYAPWTGSTAAASNASAGDGSTAVGYTVVGQINHNGFNFAASVGGSTVTNYNTVFFAYTASAEL